MEALQQQQQNSPPGSSQVVQLCQDSDKTIDDLFGVLDKPEKQRGEITPLRNRILPTSFFNQPNIIHSRESSLDYTNNTGAPQPGNIQAPVHPNSHPGLNPSHDRSHSCPVHLLNNLTAAPPPPLPPAPQHGKQASVDFVSQDGQSHLLQGSWDGPKPGQQRYFGNLPADALSWPKSVSTNTLNANNQAGQGGHTPQGTLSPLQSNTTSPNVSLDNLKTLPVGWEQALTADGELYYINHMDRTTSWFDPRIPKHLQRGPMKVAPQQPGVPSTAQRPPQLLPQHLAPPPALPQLPQPQQVSPIPKSQPPPPHSQLPGLLTLSQPAQLPSVTSTPPAQNSSYLQDELRRLEEEKLRLRKQQDDISRREQLLKEMMIIPKSISEVPSLSTFPPSTIKSISTSGDDPFLGQANNLESHARQNSGDSGLGGMSSNYSLPRTPNEQDLMLSNVDEMDTHEGPKLNIKPQSSDFNMNDLQGAIDLQGAMDMGGLTDPDQPGMESDDLVPSLQMDDISNVLLEDLSKGDNLLWL